MEISEGGGGERRLWLVQYLLHFNSREHLLESQRIYHSLGNPQS